MYLELFAGPRSTTRLLSCSRLDRNMPTAAQSDRLALSPKHLILNWLCSAISAPHPSRDRQEALAVTSAPPNPFSPHALTRNWLCFALLPSSPKLALFIQNTN